MKKETIRKTAITYWSNEDDSYVTRSPLFDRVAGVGETKDEARSVFEEVLDTAFEELEKDNVVGYKKGRPAKGYVNIHCQVPEEVKDKLNRLGEKLGISQGEVITYLMGFLEYRGQTQTAKEDFAAAVAALFWSSSKQPALPFSDDSLELFRRLNAEFENFRREQKAKPTSSRRSRKT